MRSESKHRRRVAAVVLGGLIALLIALHIQRSGVIAIYSFDARRCRECGALEKESVLVVLGVTLHSRSHLAPTPLSRILDPPAGPACSHPAKHPMNTFRFRWTTETFPGLEIWRSNSGDVAHLGENERFLAVLATIGKTNLEQARGIWMTLTRIDYRSSNYVAQLYPTLTKPDVAQVIGYIQADPIFAARNPD